MSILAQLRAKRDEIQRDIEELEALDGNVDAPPVTAPEFFAEPGTVTWLLDSLLVSQSLNVLMGGEGLGKTSWAIQLSMLLAGDSGWAFGFRAPKPLRCLLVEAEGARAGLKGRMKAAAQRMNWTPTSRWMLQPVTFEDFDARSPKLERLVAASGADLVILDTLSFFFRGDLNSASEWKSYLAYPLKAMSIRYGCSFLLLHHPNKMGDHTGTKQMKCDADSWFDMQAPDLDEKGRPNSLKRDVWVTKQRYDRSGYPLHMEFEPSTATFRTCY